MDVRGRLDMLDRGAAREPSPRTAPISLQQVLGGEIRQNAAGQFFFRQQKLPVSLCHGPGCLAQAQQLLSEEISTLDSRLLGFDLRNALYLDTETTGLSGGTGTHAFLVGLAYFHQDEPVLVIEQLMMREHCEEKAMLEYLRERVEQASGLVTFNGKSFDAPLLDTRFCLNRLRTRLEDESHLDLLPVARRLWSAALPDCRLETLERELLGLPRSEDIPGWLIPQVYFRYLQTQDPRGLAVVAEHNRRDILAMVGLVAGLSGYLREPLLLDHRFRADLTRHEDCALGRLFFRLRRFEQAQLLLERAFWESGVADSTTGAPSAGPLLARLYNRLGQGGKACEVWQAMLRQRPDHDGSLEGLAKHLEHREKDFPSALCLTERALAISSLARGRRGNWQRRRDRLLRRLDSSA